MKKLILPAIIENLDTMLEFILSVLNDTGVDARFKNKIRLSCEEALVNIIHYAYPDKQGLIEIRCEIREEQGDVWIQIIDEGIPYNPLLKEDPDIGLPMENRKIGGLGVFLYKAIMDEEHYEYTDNKNILTFSKKLYEG